jgi:hypothetical protein
MANVSEMTERMDKVVCAQSLSAASERILRSRWMC